MNTERAKHNLTLGFKCSTVFCGFIVLFLAVLSAHLAAQERRFLSEHDCDPTTIALSDNPHLIVHFTVDPNVPLSEPPIRECKFGVQITDRLGKEISRWGPVLLSAPPIREITKVHNRDIILFGAGQFFLLAVNAGEVKQIGFWQGEKLEYFPLQNGDLQIVWYRAYDQYAELPDVYRFDGVVIVPDDEGRKTVFERIVSLSVSDLRSTDQRPTAGWVQGLGAMMKLRKACIRVLRAEAVLGNASYAMMLCEEARKEISAVAVESCSSKAPNCMDGLRDTELGLITDATSEVMKTEPYRKLAVQPPKVK